MELGIIKHVKHGIQHYLVKNLDDNGTYDLSGIRGISSTTQAGTTNCYGGDNMYVPIVKNKVVINVNCEIDIEELIRKLNGAGFDVRATEITDEKVMFSCKSFNKVVTLSGRSYDTLFAKDIEEKLNEGYKIINL